MFNTLNRRAAAVAAVATLLLVASILIGSRNLGNFDAALIAYLFGCIFACFGVVYRYTVWLQRPPTWRYFSRGWRLFFTGRTMAYGWELVRHFFVQFLGQKFIHNRGQARGYGHMLMAWGCMLAFAITFPLVFGWIRFGLKPGGITTYEIFTFGFKVMEFPLHTWLAEIIFNGLNWSAILVIAGVMIMIRRRLTHAGQIAIQTFEGDWLPLLVLLAISLTGLGISLDYRFMEGKAHQFMAITHALFLLWLPFGKFYHIIQRPAQLGIAIYRKAGNEGPQAICPHNGEKFTSQMHLDDVKDVTAQLVLEMSAFGFEGPGTFGILHHLIKGEVLSRIIREPGVWRRTGKLLSSRLAKSRRSSACACATVSTSSGPRRTCLVPLFGSSTAICA